MKQWTEAQSLILPDLKDCPWEMAKSRLILAAREFFARSGAWVVRLDPIGSIAGMSDYPEVVPSQNMEIAAIHSAYYGTDKLEPVTADEFFSLVNEEPGGRPQYMTVDADALYIHAAPPDTGVEINIKAAFKPTLAGAGLPDDLWEQYIEHIVEGAKARLYASQAKPYSDLNLVAAARSAFNHAIGVARERASKGMVRSKQRVRGHFF